jgi:hypothetical protein
MNEQTINAAAQQGTIDAPDETLSSRTRSGRHHAGLLASLLLAADCLVGDAKGTGGLRSGQPGVQSTPQLATR